MSLKDLIGGKKPTAPAIPTLPGGMGADPNAYKGVATEQGAANRQAAQDTATINRPDQQTPWGNLSWSQGGGNFDSSKYDSATKAWQDAGGQGTAPTKEAYGYDPNAWTSKMTLDPGLQDMLTKSWGNTNAAISQPLDAPAPVDLNNLQRMVQNRYNNFSSNTQSSEGDARESNNLFGNAAKDWLAKTAGGVDYSSTPDMPTASDSTRQSVADAMYGQATSRLNPRFSQGEDQLRTKLAAQGITQGSEAYNREMNNFNLAKNDAYTSANNSATTGSTDAMQKLFDMGLSARQQGVSEVNNQHLIPLQEIQAGSGINDSYQRNAQGWQGMQNDQQRAIDASGANTFNIMQQNGQTPFNNRLSSRQQLINEMLGIKTNANPNFSANNNVASVEANPVLQALMAQITGQNGQYSAALGKYGTDMGARNAALGGAADIAGAFMMMP